jgi:hypothetical protein
MIGSEHSIVLSKWNASIALPVIDPLECSASFLVALFNGSQILAKSMIYLWKKIPIPIKGMIFSFFCNLHCF